MILRIKRGRFAFHVFFVPLLTFFRKDAGAVDRDGLENRCTLTGTQGSNPCLSANYHHESAANQAFAADFIFDTYKNPYKLQTKPNPIQCGRYHRNSTPRTKVSCNVRRENKVSRYFSNDNRRADFIYRLCPPHRIFRLMPIYPVCSAFIIRQCCHGTFSRSILGHLLLSGMFSPCHFCRVWT